MAGNKDKRYIIDNPILIAEWDYEKNQGLKPDKFTSGSNKKVGWKCSKGHSWEAPIVARVNGGGCPYCVNRRVLVGYNDLTTTAPHLAEEWLFEKNYPLKPENFTIGSGKKVWWVCPLGHEYKASILHRGHGTNCPICNLGRQTSFAEQAVYYYVKQMYLDAINRDLNALGNRMELDIYIPSIYSAIEYDGIFWHKKTKVKKREEGKYKKCIENGIYLIRIREVKETDKKIGVSSEHIYSGLAKQSFDINADCVFYIQENYKKEELDILIRQVLERLESNAYRLTSIPRYIAPSIIDINVRRDEQKIRKYMQSAKSKSLAILYPDIANEWHPTKNGGLLPSVFTPGSDFLAHWRCVKCGHDWLATISHRVGGTGCPKCYREGLKVKHPNDTPIYQYNIDGTFIKEWRSASEAGRVLKINPHNISTCAKHDRKSAGGYRWEYKKTERLELIIEKRTKTILQMDDDENIIREFDSLKEASKTLKVDATTISHVLHGRLKHAGGFCWKFKDLN